ncbi:hypothetical protein [Qipengyuania aquimaris]|uniref:hypothetical protein n=1 Tax=Qipengyuania aquimaris TaxID=255984 RepID=UPI001CD3EDDE|nr:hypothetical protein [Qipengyuania aquimaris]MCA0903581.1 hypothetical protein [Qipengyuania aquimaris]
MTHAIKSAHLPTHVLGKQVKRSRVTQPAPDTVVTTLLGEGGREMMHFVTTVTPDGTGSRVATEIAIPEGVKERLDEAVAKDPMANYAMNLMHVVAREHVVAAIEGRPFDMTLGNPKAEVAMQMNPEMRAQIEEANKAASDMAKQEQQMHFSQSYGNDWGDSGSSTGDGWGD